MSKRLSILMCGLLILFVFYFTGCAATITTAKEETTSSQESYEASKVTVQETEAKPYYGPKKRIAVAGFENKVQNWWWDPSWEIGEGMSDMLTTALFETDRFIVVERQALEDIITEQDLAEEGRIRPETAAKVGQLLGAQILIRGAITEFEHKKSGGAGAVKVKGLEIGVGEEVAYVAIDVRMYDSTTGQVLQSRHVEKTAKTTGVAVAGAYKGIAFGGSSFEKTPLGKVTREAIKDAINFIVAQMETVPWEGRVVKADTLDKIYINAGADTGITVGMLLEVYKPGEELIDPETGLSLGSEETKVGVIQVNSVQDKFSIAVAVSGEAFSREDIVRYLGSQ